MVSIQSAGFTDVGRKRSKNEDTYFIDEALGLFVVSDGMGGHAAGEVASRMVVDTISEFMAKFHKNPAQDKLPVSAQHLSAPANLLLNAIHLANRVVHQKSQGNVAYQGMGATVSAVYMADDQLVVANVGDSPIYLIREGTIDRVSALHTMMAEYADLDPEGSKALSARLSHVLTRAMGLKERVEPAITEIPPSGDDIVVICSDGLSDKVPGDEILRAVLEEPPHRAGTSLVQMANDRGGEDNITVIVVHLTGTARARKPRKASPDRIFVDYDTEEDSHRSTVSELTETGVVIHTSDPIAVGEAISLTFTIDVTGRSLTLNGRVTNRGQKGITVRFNELSDEQQALLATLQKVGSSNG